MLRVVRLLVEVEPVWSYDRCALSIFIYLFSAINGITIVRYHCWVPISIANWNNGKRYGVVRPQSIFRTKSEGDLQFYFYNY